MCGCYFWTKFTIYASHFLPKWITKCSEKFRIVLLNALAYTVGRFLCTRGIYICIDLSIRSSWGVAIMPSKLLLHVIPLQKQCRTCIACFVPPRNSPEEGAVPPPPPPPWWKLWCWPGYLCHTGIREVPWTKEVTNFLKEFELKVVGVVSHGHLRVSSQKLPGAH